MDLFKRAYLFVLLSFGMLAQTAAQEYDYRILSFQDKYEEIDSFKSILIETRGDQGWSKKFNLPFKFPFYDSLYNHIYCDFTSTCWFENSLDYEIVLMGNGYDFDIVNIDTNNIVSDIRYRFFKKNNLNALVLQYTKVRLISDPSVAEFDSHLNFQVWYYENGTMEVRFGNYSLDNSPNYIPGDGFYLLPNNHDPIYYGPEMLIRNAFKENVGLGLDGPYHNYTVDNIGGYLTELPPKGWVIRFERFIKSGVSNKSFEEVKIYPNPTDNLLTINYAGNIKKAIIRSVSGENIKVIEQDLPIINTAILNRGIYFLEIHTTEGVKQVKFIKF